MPSIPTFPGPRDGSVGSSTSRARATSLPAATARGKQNLQRNRDVLPAEYVIKGRTRVLGLGEATVDIRFPVIYIEPPIFQFGGELAEGSSLVQGTFPTISAIVSQWEIDEPDLDLFGQSLRIWYRGATLAIVTTGPPDTDVYLHWTFTGRAVSNPVAGSETVPPITI